MSEGMRKPDLSDPTQTQMSVVVSQAAKEQVLSEAWATIPGYKVHEINPSLLYGPDNRQILLINRSFEDVDVILDYLPSKYIGERVQGGELPVSVLDVGGGHEAKAARDIADRFGDKVSVTNLDILLPQNTELFGKVKPALGSVTKMPIQDESQDVVYSCYALTYLLKEDLPDALSEIARVLKSGGVAILLEESFTQSVGLDELEALGEKLGVRARVHQVQEYRPKHPADRMLILSK